MEHGVEALGLPTEVHPDQIKNGGCGKGQGSKLISEESGAPVTKADVESTAEAEYTHISGGQSSSGPTVRN